MTEQEQEEWTKSGPRMSRLASKTVNVLIVVFSAAIIVGVISLLVGGA